MKREGRGQDRVGGAKDAGQLLCHRDSGEGEEEEGWSGTSLQEAARLAVAAAAGLIRQPAANSSLQGHSCCAEAEFSSRRLPPAQAELIQLRVAGTEGGEGHIPSYTFILENKFVLKIVLGIPREPAM